MKHLTNAFEGKNQWWRYLLLFLASFFGGQFIGSIPLLITIAYKVLTSGGMIMPNPQNIADLSVFGIDQNLGLFLMIIPFLFSLIVLFLLFKPFHGRNYKTLISGILKIRWSRFFLSAAIWVSIFGVYLFIDYSIHPVNYSLNFHSGPFIILCLISLTMIPFQASYEEFLFRAYIAQGIAVWTKSRVMVILIPAVLFGLMHSLNPEVDAYGFWMVMPQYILFGIIFGLLTVMDDGIELAMGAHSANNIFMSIFVTSKSSVLQTPALLVQNTIEPAQDMLILVVAGFVLVAVLSYIYKWDYRLLLKPIRRDS
jgi:uncharacterized protein